MNADFADRSTEERTPLVHALRVLRDRWFIVVIAVVLCTGITTAVSVSSTKKYQATSELLFRPNQLGTAVLNTPVVNNSVDPQRDSSTNQGLVHSLEVAQAVEKTLRLGLPASDLLDKISVQSAENSDIIQVTATDTEPKRAARIANGFATGYVAFAQRQAQDRISQGEQLLRQRLAALPADSSGDADRRQLQDALQKLLALEAVQTGDAQVVDRADPPSSPSSPKPARDAILGVLFGLALGVGLVFLLDALDRRVKTPEDFERLYGLRSLVNVPQASFRARTPETRGPAFEPYRILRSEPRLRGRGPQRPHAAGHERGARGGEDDRCRQPRARGGAVGRAGPARRGRPAAARAFTSTSRSNRAPAASRMPSSAAAPRASTSSTTCSGSPTSACCRAGRCRRARPRSCAARRWAWC